MPYIEIAKKSTKESVVNGITFRSKNMTARKIEVVISGMDATEQEAFARKIKETIQKVNRLSEEKITYQISFQGIHSLPTRNQKADLHDRYTHSLCRYYSRIHL